MISPALAALIDRRAAEYLAEIRRLAEHARRSIGQRTRYALQRMRADHDHYLSVAAELRRVAGERV